MTNTGQVCTATWLFMATGGISIARTPDFPGQHRFAGVSTHTVEWPPEGINIAGKRVAIIGTGSSAIQAIPELATDAQHLFVLQRSPNYVVPSQNSNRDLFAEQQIKGDYAQFRRDNDRQSNGFGSRWDRSEASVLTFTPEERERRFEKAWETGGFSFLFTFGDLTSDDAAAAEAAEFIRGKIRSIVDVPAVADKLVPRHVFGCRRLCVGTDYYEAFNRENVTIIDVSDAPISEITETGVRYGDDHLDIDVLIYATGFEDQAESLRRMSICGSGQLLSEAWHSQPSNYLGVAIAGFPNMFMVNLPGSPSIATNMITNTEFTVDWIADCILHAARTGCDRIEAQPDAQTSWTSYVDSLAAGKVYEHCQNLYTDVDANGHRFAFPHLGVPAYLDRIRASAAHDFVGMHFSSALTRTSHSTPSESIHHITEELV